MGHHLFAVLVPAHATVVTVDGYLQPLLEPLRGPGTFDEYRLGGQTTGAWDEDYNPTLDPANWRPCDTCDGTPPGCLHCGDAVRDGRPQGAILAPYWDWQPHGGDIVPLSRLLDPAWRFPRRRSPVAWVDRAGLVWLDNDLAVLTGTDGDVPPRLALIFEHLTSGRRRLPGRPGPFTAGDWSVAVVDTHR
jgi:hypothetical protein